jgi:epoxyqueuosine reductase QueG
MSHNDMTDRTRHVALTHGADLVGIVKVVDLPEHKESILRILPDADSLVVLASKHGLAAISSLNNQVAQFDTIHTYNVCAEAAHHTSRFLESEGFASVAVPAFIPLDMEKPKHGMKGEICWRRAGVRAGLGSYGENGLLVTKEFGSAVRISGVVTTAGLRADVSMGEDVCNHCMACIEACPAGALSGGGKINKKRCGGEIFKFGFRYFRGFVQALIENRPAETERILEGTGLMEMWQTFMTGNYYYCFKCQSQCPATKLPPESRLS